MYRASKIIELATSKDYVTIIPFGDLHLGSENCDLRGFKNFIASIKDKPNTYLIGMGDFLESTLPSNKHFDASTPFTPFEDSYQQVKSIVEPVKKQLLGLLIGNHEYRMTSSGYGDPIKRLSLELSVPYLGYSAFYRLTAQWMVGKKRQMSSVTTFYLNHGWFSGRKTGSKVNNMEDCAAYYDADVYIFGHSHSTIGTRRMQLHFCGAREKIFMNSGTFLKTNSWSTSGYAERRGYPPTRVGVGKLSWYPFKSKHVETGTMWGEYLIEA